MENRSDLDEQLKEIAGGHYGDDFWYAIQKMGNDPAAIRKAINTNTCPFCNQPVIPDAKACDASDFFSHLHSKHPDL